MLKYASRLALAAALLLTPMSAAFSADALSDAQKKEVGAVIESYLKEHPEAVINAIDAYRAKIAAEANQKTEAVGGKIADMVKKGDTIPVVGSKKGDVLVVEFFDYNCGYCKKAFDGIRHVAEKDKNVTVALVETPILGDTSVEAAKWALAAKSLGKYWEFHKALMEFQGPKTPENLRMEATKVGLDADKMAELAKSDKINEELGKLRALASEAQVQGTPTFMINGKVQHGLLSADDMENAIKQARDAKN